MHPIDSGERARRRLLIFALVIAAGFGALAFVNFWTGRDNPREGSRVLSGGGAPLRITTVPRAYRAVIRVDNRAAEDKVVTTERVWVRRPFQSRVETYTGPPPGTSRLSVRQSAFGVLTSRSPRSQPLNIAAPPSLASGDLRIDAALDEAVEDRTILKRERREVFGRECQVYRAGGPVFAGDIEPYEGGTGNFADVCIDRNGLVLEEAWTHKGRLIQRRAVTELDVNPAIDSKIFEIDVPPSEGAFRGAVERIEDGDDVVGLWELPSTPRGFEALGRYGIVIPQAATPGANQQTQLPGPSSTSDVYLRGPDVLVIDQDPSLARVIDQESRPTHKVKLPNLRNGTLIVDARMTEVRGIADDGSVVRIFGTLPPSELLDLARSLRPQE